ncbi:MAG: hypothetical protein QOK40_2869 [Miltoncostaeaceae bacterium]|nr:hypothetical protein [Miltoncostaeaceae bacterium]
MTRGGAPVPDGSMLEALVDGVLTIDRDGRIVGLDPRAALLFGLRPHETALGRPVADLIPSLRLPEALSTWGGRRRGAGPRVIARRVESLALRADGAGLPIELTLTDTGEEPPRITAWIRALSRVEGDHAALAQRTALLEAAERLAQSGSWDWNLLTNELVWSDNMYRLFGLEPGAIPPSPDYVFEQTHPDDRACVREAIRRARGTGSLAPLPFRIVRGDGEVRHLHATTTIVAAGGSGGRRLVGVLQDVTDRRRAEREIAAHFAVSEALLEWETLERGGPRLLGNLAEAMDFEVGFLWVPLDDVLVARCTWRAPSVRASRFEAATGRARLRPGCDLPGRVWRAREPINLAFLPPAADLPRRDAALRAGLRGEADDPSGAGDDLSRDRPERQTDGGGG